MVFPRMCLIGFNIAQPLLIYRVTSFLSQSQDHQSRFINRCITITRGGLISLIYSRTLQLSSLTLSESPATTLMSADIDRI
ncbi:hypothetical protein N7495_000871 [Penicillium taxi]|uniref:uncharacterized protein n=1 Tax=Penicillium taxi TaxID=168475 RepID=UPI002545B2D4|nr:uncharacterized protein N7495_000871 [Penicillium taxi]KAJ5908189.1 hypothetical protein N7495_000871 [Penicillium taxi]